MAADCCSGARSFNSIFLNIIIGYFLHRYVVVVAVIVVVVDDDAAADDDILMIYLRALESWWNSQLSLPHDPKNEEKRKTKNAKSVNCCELCVYTDFDHPSVFGEKKNHKNANREANW